MIRRLQITLLALFVSVWAMASETSVKNADGVEIWYDFDSSAKTASVTYKGSSYNSYSNEYTGEVVIPSTVTYEGVVYSVTEIVKYAFRDCSGLTSVTIPESVTSIVNYAFRDCSGLTSIEVASGNENYIAVDGVLFNKDMTSLIQYPVGKDAVSYNIPEGVTEIGDGAFEGCSGLTSVTIPKGVTEIGDFAFYRCSGLTSVTIPERVTVIGDYAFKGCSGFTSVTIPEGVTSIEDGAFEGCSGLTSVTIPKGVTEIGEGAFFNCRGLTSVTIPEGVTEIGQSAFNGTAIYNNESNWENNVLYIDNCLIDVKTKLSGEYAIKEDTRLIASSAFLFCSGLTSVTIPEGVTSIGYGAFSYCSGLTSVTIPKSVTKIGGSAFSGTAIYNNESNWENNVLYIDNCLIDVKTELSGEYAIKEDTRLIASYAFYNCSVLTSVTIPEGVTEIGDYAFSGCSALTSMTSKNTTPLTVLESTTFEGVNKSIPLYVPAESVEAYMSAEGWKEFTNILPIQVDSNPISDVNVDNISVRPIGNNIVVTGTDNYTVYSISGQSLGKVTSVERGIYIVVAEGKSYKVAVK